MSKLKIILYSSQKSQRIIYQDYDFEWANKNIDENHIKYLSKTIANATEKFIHVPKTEDFTRGDFATLYNIVKPVRDKQIDDRIKTYWESRTSSDMFSIGLALGVGEDNLAASTVLPEEPIPVHNRDYSYFMDQFKNSFYEGKNYHELIKEQKCRYVHDVQHYLMDEFGEDDLKIHHIL